MHHRHRLACSSASGNQGDIASTGTGGTSLKRSPTVDVQETRFRIAAVTAPDHTDAMRKARRSSKRDQRRVFRPRRRFPYGPVLRQLTVVVLMLAAAAWHRCLLNQLPQQVDIMLLLSKAIDDLIGGVQQLLEAMLGLAAIVLIAAIALLAGILLLGALWRLIRIIRLVVSPPHQGSLRREHIVMEAWKRFHPDHHPRNRIEVATDPSSECAWLPDDSSDGSGHGRLSKNGASTWAGHLET